MENTSKTLEKIGYTCAYAPLALIDSGGYAPYRIFPITEAPDQAGHILHDNLCPHIKRVLDRAIQNDLPDLSKMVFINSCNSMHRLYDAWKKVRPDDQAVLLDLPATTDQGSVNFFADELSRFADILGRWRGRPVLESDIQASIEAYNRLEGMINDIIYRLGQGELKGGAGAVQDLFNRISTQSVDRSVDDAQSLLNEPALRSCDDSAVPILLFGNVLFDPQALSLMESAGARITDMDTCTGSRLLKPIETSGSNNIFLSLAEGLIRNKPCARTFDPGHPVKMAEDILSRIKTTKAKGVIAYTLKFCDPYIDRLPTVSEVLKKSSIPFLLLEGDCSMGSIGQQQTRIEAFIEMLR